MRRVGTASLRAAPIGLILVVGAALVAPAPAFAATIVVTTVEDSARRRAARAQG